jgi:hypothetical protein
MWPKRDAAAAGFLARMTGIATRSNDPNAPTKISERVSGVAGATGVAPIASWLRVGKPAG